MASSSSVFLNAFEKNEESKIMNYYHAFFNFIFPVYHTMLKYYFYSFYTEIFFIILEYLNLMVFILSKPVRNIYYFNFI
jgi:hypothetical protein